MTLFLCGVFFAAIFFMLGFAIGQTAGYSDGYGQGKFNEKHKGTGMVDELGITP